MRFKTLLIQDHQEVGFTGKTKFEAKHRVLPPRSLNHIPFVIGIALMLFNNMMGTDHRDNSSIACCQGDSTLCLL